jgi:NarL family two-component system response regulator LiaR
MLTRVMELRITKKVLDGLTRVPLETPSLADLTRRETEILAHIAKGRNNKEIARDLSLALSTVKFHVGSILSKLNLSDRTQAAVWAIRMGLVKQDTSTLGE